MNYQHKELAEGKWYKLTFLEQMANIGSEVERAISWRNKNKEYSRKAFHRALELLELTLSDGKNKKFSILKEISRLKEVLVDFFITITNFLPLMNSSKNIFTPLVMLQG